MIANGKKYYTRHCGEVGHFAQSCPKKNVAKESSTRGKKSISVTIVARRVTCQ